MKIMRCIILNKRISYDNIILKKNDIAFDEIVSRIEYFQDIFNLYYSIKEVNGNVELISLPINELDYVFIIGHNNEVYNYLLTNKVKENNIVLITCYQGFITKFTQKNKRIFVPNSTNGETKYYDGSKWNFNFNITDCELNLYKSKEINYDKKIMQNFKEVQNGKSYRKN